MQLRNRALGLGLGCPRPKVAARATQPEGWVAGLDPAHRHHLGLISPKCIISRPKINSYVIIAEPKWGWGTLQTFRALYLSASPWQAFEDSSIYYTPKIRPSLQTLVRFSGFIQHVSSTFNKLVEKVFYLYRSE